MNKRSAFLLFVLLNLLAGNIYAQTQKHTVDSLKQLLSLTNQDTTEVILDYLIGMETNITRVSYWDSLQKKAHTNNQPLYECKIWHRIGSIHASYGTIHQEIYSFQKGLSIAEKNGLKTEQISFCQVLGKGYGILFDRKSSLAMIYKGLKIAEEIGDKKAVINFYTSIALYHLTSGEPNKALNIYLRCLTLSKEIKYDFGTAGLLLDIGNTYETMGLTPEAVPYYLEIKQYMHAAAGTKYEVQLCCALASAHYFLNQIDSAYYYIEKGYGIAQHFEDKKILAGAMVTYAGLHYLYGNNKAAKSYALQALEIVKATQFTSQLSILTQLLKKIYIKDHDFENALKIYEFDVHIRDSLSNENVRKQAIEKEFAYNLEKKEDEYNILAQKNEIQALQLTQGQYLLAGLVCLLIIILIIVYLFIRQNRLRADHQRIQLEQKLLRTQMNPHFIFNSLNSIQQFIMKLQNEQAELYLSKFSKLIRNLLESNTKESLTVREEVEMLNAYLEMESLRFGATFSYSVHVDKQIDTAGTHIPHLMLQPFIENAIWHGLLPNHDNRVLQVNIEYDTNKTIKCTVDDNGIGREISMKRQDTLRKKSLALSFVQQRLDLIRETYNIAGSISFTDKKNTNNESLGTRVVIILPII